MLCVRVHVVHRGVVGETIRQETHSARRSSGQSPAASPPAGGNSPAPPLPWSGSCRHRGGVWCWPVWRSAVATRKTEGGGREVEKRGTEEGGRRIRHTGPTVCRRMAQCLERTETGQCFERSRTAPNALSVEMDSTVQVLVAVIADDETRSPYLLGALLGAERAEAD